VNPNIYANKYLYISGRVCQEENYLQEQWEK
jgi:hypothetical protein